MTLNSLVTLQLKHLWNLENIHALEELLLYKTVPLKATLAYLISKTPGKLTHSLDKLISNVPHYYHITEEWKKSILPAPPFLEMAILLNCIINICFRSANLQNSQSVKLCTLCCLEDGRQWQAQFVQCGRSAGSMDSRGKTWSWTGGWPLPEESGQQSQKPRPCTEEWDIFTLNDCVNLLPFVSQFTAGKAWLSHPLCRWVQRF